jgi:hypothetical protein
MGRLVVDIENNVKNEFEEALVWGSTLVGERISKSKKIREWIVEYIKEMKKLRTPKV